MNQHPLIALVFSVIFTLYILKQCITRKKFIKVRLLLAFFLTFIAVLLLAFYSEIQKANGVDYLNWGLLGLEIVVGILFIVYSELSTTEEQFTLDLLEVLEETKFFVFIDRKNRIKEISALFLEDLGISLEEAYRMNFFELLEQKYKIKKLNGSLTSSEDLDIYFKDIRNRNKELLFELEDENGDPQAFYLRETYLMTFNMFRGRILIGDKKGSENLMGMERNLANSIEELDMISSRFSVILEKTEEGIFFTNQQKDTIWLSKPLAKLLNFEENELSFRSYIGKIHSDDRELYETKLSQVNNINPDYSITYRFCMGTKELFLKEQGRRISNGKTVELCGVIKLLDNYRFEKTQSDLDTILGEAELLTYLNNSMKNKNTVIQVVLIQMKSLPEINEKYGRGIGNVALSEYIRLFKKLYIDNNLIFRLSGLEFVAVITDYRKMNGLENNLKDKEKILHVPANYGKTKVIIDTILGICNSTDGKDAKDVLSKAREALKHCGSSRHKENYVYYKDIK